VSRYSVAHSPDADDIFMYYAIKFGWVGDRNFGFDNIALDIETLNQKALNLEFDICAISFALYPFIKNDYSLLRTAASFGEGYGPKLIKRKNTKLKKNFKVALSGKYTTNAMLFRIFFPEAKIYYMNFLEIEKAVLEGMVDGGVLIHESILNYNSELECEVEIYDLWKELAKEDLPLPLGGMVIKRSIPLLRAITIENMLQKAIDIGLKHKKLLSKMLLQRDLIRVDEKTLDIYLNLCANEKSVLFDKKALKSLNLLFKIGYDYKIYDSKIEVEDYLIPKEYKDLRLD